MREWNDEVVEGAPGEFVTIFCGLSICSQSEKRRSSETGKEQQEVAVRTSN
jgi:hypothetical protein